MCAPVTSLRNGVSTWNPYVAHVQLLDWNAFDVFAVSRLSSRRPLQTVTWALLQHFGLVDSLSLPPDKLRSFLKVRGCRPGISPCA